MVKADIDKIVYDKSVIDFVTVAVEVCVFLEKNDEPLSREQWIDRLLKMLPLLYVKALLLPETATMGEQPATFVREEDYLRVANGVSGIMREEDVYLDVFVEDMRYSDTPVSTFVSENIADIYQDIRDFVAVYRFGVVEHMNEALYRCKENFRLYWGQKLVNVLRPLHALVCTYAENRNDEEVLSEEELWN